MANARSYSIGPRMSNAELIAGLLYLPFFAGLLKVVLSYVCAAAGLELTSFQFNFLWFCVNGAFCLVTFHKFLWRSFRSIRFWPLIQTIILGAVLYQAGNFLLTLLWELLKKAPENFNNDTIVGFAQTDFRLTLVMTVVIAPVVEELLIRGVLFGGLRRKSRVAAYLVSMVVFSAMHISAYISQYDWRSLLLVAGEYLPAGLTLGWTYEKTNTIWTPIFLHMLINAVSMSLI